MSLRDFFKTYPDYALFLLYLQSFFINRSYSILQHSIFPLYFLYNVVRPVFLSIYFLYSIFTTEIYSKRTTEQEKREFLQEVGLRN